MWIASRRLGRYMLLFVVVGTLLQELRGQRYAPLDALSLPVDAAAAALGDYNVSYTAPAVALMWQNPALLADTTALQLSVSFADYFADIRAGATSVRFAVGASRRHLLGFGLRYLSYGRFEGYDAVGISTGSFSAFTTLFALSYAHRLGPFSLGVSLLPAYGRVAFVGGGALFADVGATFTHPSQELRFGVAVKHLPLLGVGRAEQRSPLDGRVRPVDVWLGMTYRPRGMPFRFSFTVHSLAQARNYTDSDSPEGVHRRSRSIFMRMLNHCNFGLEFVLNKRARSEERVSLQAALTPFRRQLQTDDGAALLGFSFGGRLRLGWLWLQAAYSFHELRRGRTQVALQLDVSALSARRPRKHKNKHKE